MSQLEGLLDLMLSNRTPRASYQSQDLPDAVGPKPAGGALYPWLRPFAICWVCFLVLSPIYVFESGLPQPADGLMAIMILVLATGYFIRVPIYTSLYLVASVLLGYISLVNAFWYALYFDHNLLLASSYYVYNFGVVVLVLSLAARFGTGFFTITRAGFAAALALEWVACVLVPTDSLREIGTFNNPNQLGYWSLATLSCWLVLKGDRRLDLGDLLVIAASGHLVILSLSRAALLAYGGLVILGLIGQGLRIRLGWSLGVVLAVVAPLLIFQSALLQGFSEGDGVVANAVNRLEKTGTRETDTPEHRGYDRIWLYPEHLLMGAGEGAYERFSRSGGRQTMGEFHSTLGTILFSYGMIGLALFSLLLYQILRKAPIRHFFYFFSFLIYGLTHQGLRSTLLWILLGLVFSLANVNWAAKREPAVCTADR